MLPPVILTRWLNFTCWLNKSGEFNNAPISIVLMSKLIFYGKIIFFSFWKNTTHFNSPEITKKFTDSFFSVRLFMVKHARQTTYDCIPNEVENLCHNSFLRTPKIESIFHHIQVWMLLQAVSYHCCAISNMFSTVGNFLICLSNIFDIPSNFSFECTSFFCLTFYFSFRMRNA